jgi:hypothetical protein
MGKLAWMLGASSLSLAVLVVLLWNRLQTQEALIGRLQADVTKVHAPERPETPATPVPDIAHLEATSPAPDIPERNVDSRIESDPNFRVAMVDYQHIDMLQRNVAFFATIGLSREKADRVAMILAEQAVQGIHGIPEQFTREQWRQKNEDELRAELSQAEIDALRHYRESAESRDQVETLRNELMTSGEPLRDKQIAPLVEALHTEEMRLFEETRGFNAGLDQSPEMLAESERRSEDFFVEREAAATTRKLEAASRILSHAQLQALARQLEMQRALGLAGAKVRRLHDELARSLATADPAAGN